MKSTENMNSSKSRKSRNKITFRIYTIDRTLTREEIQDSIDLNTDEVIPKIYILLLENKEMNNIDKLYDKYERSCQLQIL